MAEKAAWNSWEDSAQIANLCCGLAGRSYGLLHFYNYTGEKAWLVRARELANRGAISIRAAPLDEYKGFEYSLYKGELGVALLSADLARPEEASFPFFESERWSADSTCLELTLHERRG
jgi:serine/threonine-protein kinase